MTSVKRAPKISVALATFQGSPFLQEQVGSIVAQSRAPDEIVVADDGSTDDSLDIIRASLVHYPHIRLVVLESRAGHGVTANFARALKASSGDLIALCDQDDTWHPDRLACAARVFDEHPEVALVNTNARLVDREGRSIGTTLFSALGITPALKRSLQRDPFPVLLRRNLITGATMMIRRELLDSSFPLPSEWVHDEWLAIIAAATGRIQVLDELLVDYRQHGANQIGVALPTMSYRMSRMIEPDNGRASRLARRSQILALRLSGLPGASIRDRAAAEAKADFEAARATLPKARIARLSGVMRAARGGRYRTLASQGLLDIVRDLAQPR